MNWKQAFVLGLIAPGVWETTKRSLNDYSWSEISDISTSGKAASKFALGDTKDITLTTGEVVTMRIIGFNHDDLSDGSGKAGITFEMCHCLTTTYCMDASNTNINGWDDSDLREKLQTGGEIYTMLPSDVLSIIRPVLKLTSEGNMSPSIQTTEEVVFLLSETEVRGSSIYASEGEGVQYGYYETIAVDADQRRKCLANGSGDGIWWWTRSPYLNNTANFVPFVTGGTSGWASAGSSGGVSFAFCI